MPVITASPLAAAAEARTGHPPRSRSVPVAVAFALLAVGSLCVAIVAGLDVPVAGSVPHPALLTVVAASAVLLLLLQIAGHRRSTRGDVVAESVTEPVLEAGVGPQDAGRPGHVPPDVLELQVRSLEEALTNQDERLDEMRRRADDRLQQLRHQDRERVRLTLVALRGRLAGEAGVVALNRIETALSRLGSEPLTGRPLLSPGPSGSSPVVLAVPVPQAALRPESSATTAPSAAPAPSPEPELPAGVPEPTLDAQPPPPAVTKVLPVPAPVVDAVPRRGRRGNRRGALV